MNHCIIRLLLTHKEMKTGDFVPNLTNKFTKNVNSLKKDCIFCVRLYASKSVSMEIFYRKTVELVRICMQIVGNCSHSSHIYF